MKKIFEILLVVVLVFATSSVYANEDIQAILEQLAVYKAKAGDKLEYKLNLKLPEEFEKKYKSFAVTVLMDPNLKINSVNLTGIKEIKGEVDTKITNVETNSQNLVTFYVNNTSLLKKQKEISLLINSQVKKALVTEDNFKNSFVLTYTDKKGVEGSKQKDFTSNTVGDDGNLKISDYFDTSSKLKGNTKANANILVKKDNKEIAKGQATKEGNFEINLRGQKVGDILLVSSTYKLNGESKVSNEKVIVKAVETDKLEETVEESKDLKSMEKLSDSIDMAKKLNYSKADKEDAARLVAAIANGQYIEIKSEPKENEIKEAVDKLEEAVKYLRKPIMTGYSEDNFSPEKNIKRSEIAAVLAKISGGDKITGEFTSFKDVKQDKWYADAIAYMEKSGIINGYQDGTFKPEKSISRAEFANLIAKISETESLKEALNFKDVEESFWAKESIDKVTSLGYMSGRNNGEFDPNQEITRAEVAKVLNRVLERVPNKDYIDKYTKNPYKDVKKSFWAYYEIMEISGN